MKNLNSKELVEAMIVVENQRMIWILFDISEFWNQKFKMLLYGKYFRILNNIYTSCFLELLNKWCVLLMPPLQWTTINIRGLNI